ncbi:MAG: hypothetical protein ACYTG5_06820 [Planctomycetota bacterium]
MPLDLGQRVSLQEVLLWQSATSACMAKIRKLSGDGTRLSSQPDRAACSNAHGSRQ